MAKSAREAKLQRTNQAKAARLAAARRARRLRVGAVIAVIALICLGVGGSITVFGGSSSKTASSVTTTTAPGPDTACPPADGSAPKTLTFAKAPPMCIDTTKKYTADFDTTMGHVVVDLNTDRTPTVTNNFVVLARYHYYDGTNFMRTNTGIDIIQGGAPSQSNSDPGPGYTINDEGGPFTYKEGDLVMARTQQPNSTGAQFFFAAGPKVSNLDNSGPYLTFGHVTQGLDVLHAILATHKAADQSQPDEGAPANTVTVKTITITES